MTRFGEILLLWKFLSNIWQLFEGLISIWQTFEPTLENSVCFWAIYIAVNVQILSKHSRHLVTLIRTRIVGVGRRRLFNVLRRVQTV